MEIRDSLNALGHNDTHYIRSDRTVMRLDDCFFYDDQGLYVTVCITAEDMANYLEGERDMPYATTEYDQESADEGEECYFPWDLNNGFKRLEWFDDVEVWSMTLDECKGLIGDIVDVNGCPECSDFRGTVSSCEENDIDGILISVLDQEDNMWDVEPKYVERLQDGE